MSFLMLAASPVAAVAEKRAANIPETNEMTAIPKSMPPYFKIGSIPLPNSSINIAMISGITVSMTTSTTIKIGASIDGFLYSLTLFPIVFNKCISLLYVL